MDFVSEAISDANVTQIPQFGFSENVEEKLGAPDFSERLHQTGLSVYEYYTPLLFIFGILGNSIAIVVFLRESTYRKQSSSYYLSALAVSDSLYLLNLCAVWLGFLTSDVITYSFACPLVMYIGQLTPFLSVYLTVAFSIERCIAINIPFRRPQICTISGAKYTIAGILVIGLVAFSYVWVVAEVRIYSTKKGQESLCTVAAKYQRLSEIANYLDTVFLFIIPFITIACLNIGIVTGIYKKGRRFGSRKQLSCKVLSTNRNCAAQNQEIRLRLNQYSATDYILQQLQIPLAFVDGYKIIFQYEMRISQTQASQSPRLSEAKVTKTLLLVSSVFLVLNLPVHVLRCAEFLQQGATVLTDGLKLTLSLQPWALMLFNTNFAVNMLLYCLSGTKFRNSLRKSFSRKERPRVQAISHV